MSQAEELLKGLADDGATARTVDPSTEPHIVVNTDRTITVPPELKHIAVQFDHNIETVTFDCPRYWDEHDFSEMKVYVIYRRKDGYKDRYPADNLRVDETDADIIHFEWTISKNVTLVKGDISFIVCINYTDENGTERNHWNSRLNQDLIVDEGLECSTDEVVEQNPDVIESILVRLDAVERNGGGSGSGGNVDLTGVVKSVNGQTPDESGNVEITIPDSGGNITQESLAGFTYEIKPSQVAEAISAGRPVMIMYNHNLLGVIAFTSFDVNIGMQVIYSSSVLAYDGVQFLVVLGGSYEADRWEFILEEIPKMSDIPTDDYINGLIDAKLKEQPSSGGSGQDGFSPIATVEQTNTGAVISITDKQGTTTATVTNGKDGKSAYQYAQDNGYAGTEEEWLASLKGEKGEPGANGAKGDKGDPGDDYVLTVADKTEIAELAAKMVDVPEGSGSDPVPSYVRTEAERVAKVAQSRQNADTITFIAASDFHYSTKVSNAAQQKESLTHMGQAMELIRKKVHVDFTVSCGDMVWDSGETVDEAMAAMRFVSECLQNGQEDLRTRGNHDCLYSNAIGLTDAQIFANIGAWNSSAQHDPDNRLGGYCYRDFDYVKVRVICLNSAETNTGGCLFSAKQVTWLTNALNLSEKGEGWRSIIISHHPLDWGKDGGGDPIAAINGAKGVIAAFHGHTHNFKVDTITDTSIKRIAIPNACVGRENEYTTAYGINWGEATKYTKTAGTAEDTSFCVVTIDLAEKRIYADHYGAGYSREVEYVDTGDSGGSNYVNAVDTAEADNSTDLYNGTGYKVGVYCSSNGGDSEDAACIATGNMPYNWAKDNPIYIKGANVTDASHVRIYGYSTKGDAPLSSASGSGPTLSTYFTKEELETGNYFKLTPLGDLPQVEYLRLSLINTGGNLIVSFGKPIE